MSTEINDLGKWTCYTAKFLNFCNNGLSDAQKTVNLFLKKEGFTRTAQLEFQFKMVGSAHSRAINQKEKKMALKWTRALVLVTTLILICGCDAGGAERISHEPQPRFTVDGSMILDTQTNLWWKVGPDRDTNFFTAEEWVNGLGGYWRLPTPNELAALYAAGVTEDDWGPFENSSYGCIWSNQIKNSVLGDVWRFDFTDGSDRYCGMNHRAGMRVFAVTRN